MPDERKPKMTDEPVFTVRLTEATDDWMRAGRLAKRAREGDEEAAVELERMESETLVPVDELER